MGCEEKQNTEANLRTLLQRVQTPAFTDFVRCTFPLFASKGDGIRLFGSGVLFGIADRHFLISAAHVMDKAREAAQAGYRFFAASGPLERKFIPFDRITLLCSVKQGFGREDDPFDLCVGELPQGVVEAFRSRRFLHIPDVELFDQQRRESLYVVFGFPSERCVESPEGERILCEPLLYGTTLCQRDLGELRPPQNPAVDYLLNFSSTHCARVDGKPDLLPDPGGISGCGIWRIIENQGDIDCWTPQQVKLVGIEHVKCAPGAGPVC